MTGGLAVLVASVVPSGFFAPHMMLQRDRPIPVWGTAAAGEEMVKELSQGQGMGPWVHPIRVAVSGRGEGIGLFEMLQLLGRDTTLSRMRRAAETIAAA